MRKKYKAYKYNKNFVDQNMMGPNSMVILEELLGKTKLKRGMKVLDLGCGKALSSIFLANEYGVQVFAVDLWINATENYERLRQVHAEDLVIPLHLDAHQLPFADGYFDAVISVDAYQYFGSNEYPISISCLSSTVCASKPHIPRNSLVSLFINA